MTFLVNIDEEYLIKRINNWRLDMNKNKIYGETQVFGLNFDTPVSGPIIAWADNHIMARIETRLYAFVPGKVDITKQSQKLIYYDYLRTKVPKPTIVI